jgi:hypothetical protein
VLLLLVLFYAWLFLLLHVMFLLLHVMFLLLLLSMSTLPL